MTESKMPEKVWVSGHGWPAYTEPPIHAVEHTEYLRADLHDSQFKALEARIAELVAAGDALDRRVDHSEPGDNVRIAWRAAKASATSGQKLEAKEGT